MYYHKMTQKCSFHLLVTKQSALGHLLGWGNEREREREREITSGIPGNLCSGEHTEASLLVVFYASVDTNRVVSYPMITWRPSIPVN